MSAGIWGIYCAFNWSSRFLGAVITLGPTSMHLLSIRVGNLVAGIFTSSRFYPGALLVAFLTWYAHVVHELPLTLV
ncbi:hypothetical protein B0H13DRAFT_1979110 [Mycena leptocephala]|nr:hypothetical protein B0H13DRAFT_1979110 [Mycena leptocephala]